MGKIHQFMKTLVPYQFCSIFSSLNIPFFTLVDMKSVTDAAFINWFLKKLFTVSKIFFTVILCPSMGLNFSTLLWIICLQVWTVVTKMWCTRVKNWQRFCPLVIIYHQHEADKNIFLSLNQCCVMNLLFLLLKFKALKDKHKPMFSFLDQLA